MNVIHFVGYSTKEIDMEDNKKEIRNVTAPLSLSKREGDQSESRMVEGYAILFGVHSDGLYFDETIEPGALDGVIERSDVKAVLNHNVDRGVLARSRKGEGSLELIVDEKGLLYRFEAPKTALGDELLENLRRGEIRESSFCFSVKRDTWVYNEGARSSRTIHEIDELFDVSPVYDAAYSATSVYTRGLDEAKSKVEEQRAKERGLQEYFATIRKSFS